MMEIGTVQMAVMRKTVQNPYVPKVNFHVKIRICQVTLASILNGFAMEKMTVEMDRMKPQIYASHAHVNRIGKNKPKIIYSKEQIFTNSY